MGQELSVKPVRAITWTETGGREASLIQRCAARDEDACAELVSEHQRMVYQLSLNLLNDHNEALDLSQEVFLRVFRTVHSFRGHSSLRTWIYRIVVRTCLEFLEENHATVTPATQREADRQQLSPRERMVLELKQYLGLKLETIASILGVSQSAVRNSFVRAVLQLRLERVNQGS